MMRLATRIRRTLPRLEELETRVNPSSFTLLDTNVAPDANTATFDTSPVELGVRFEVQTSGTVDAIQFYRGVAIDSGYTVHLWTGDGDLLATGNVIEGQGPAPGWQNVWFGDVRVDPGQTYVASYYASEGGYSYSHSFFSTGLQNGPLLAPADAGAYTYGEGGGFPNQTYLSSNYWVTPVFTPYPAPTITGISPNSGPSAGGNLVTIFGSNFDVPDFRRIYFGDQESPAHNFISPTELLVQVPPGLAGTTVDVRIEALGGTSENTFADDYTYQGFPPPTITGISPNSGPTAGGNLVSIFGTNFDVPDFRRIFFGNQESPAHNFISATELLVVVPPGLAGTVDVRIEALGGTSQNTPTDDYTYIGDSSSSFTLFNTTVAPDASTATFDTSPVELGVQFSVQQSGTINAIQFYRGVAIDSGYTVHLWTAAGELLASGVVIEGQGPTPGWQMVQFGAIRVDPGQTYVASYYASAGGYSYSHHFFDAGFENGPLVVPANGGVYTYGLGGGFPNQTYLGSNYWVTPVFTPYPAPTITGISPNSGPLAGGNLVSILGSNFDVPDFRRIYFGDQEAPAHNFISPTELLVVVPPGVVIGTVDVRIEALGGTSENTPADDYTYLDSEGFFGF